MPKRGSDADARAAAVAAELRAERAENIAVNNAIAGTEREIFDDAMGDEPLDLDGDRSLEEMADDIGDEDAEGADEEEADEADETEDGDSDVDTEVDEDADPHLEPLAARQNDDQRDDRRGIPPGRVREMRQRDREQANSETESLRYDLAVTQARLNDVMVQLGQQRVQPQQLQQPQLQPTEPPDMFADPEGFREYLRSEAVREARTITQQEFQLRELNRVEDSLQTAAAGPRRFEFQEAYRRLTSLPRNAESARLVTGIVSSADPAAALFDWFEGNGADDFRADIAEQLGFEVDRPAPRRGDRSERRASREEFEPQAPRHETRLPQSMRRQPPSLNEARGGARRGGLDQDARGFDGSEDAIFDYAARR
ncbi:MAG TPA: hypothetical protein VFV12_08810 [Xanthobacteraceae bacterium]|nr:hypothetical protein [Xanthobacteraceae bacterium]